MKTDPFPSPFSQFTEAVPTMDLSAPYHRMAWYTFPALICLLIFSMNEYGIHNILQQ